MSDLLTLSSGKLTAKVNPLGAELWSLTDAAGREYMTDADPAFWTGHAPLLFPIVGALHQGRYRLNGSEYALPKHGFARTSRFDCLEHTGNSVRFQLRDSAETRAAYPFAFALDMTFRLEGSTLHMEATVTNSGASPMPFSFGFHPAFAWPLPGNAAKGEHYIRFAHNEPQPVRRIDPPSGLLLPEAQLSPVVGRNLHPDAAMFEADALIWDHLNSHELTFGADQGSNLHIAFPDMDMLGIWQKPGANYLCIEPWAGIADPLGFDGDFSSKPGVIVLPAGEQRGFRMDVTVQSG